MLGWLRFRTIVALFACGLLVAAPQPVTAQAPPDPASQPLLQPDPGTHDDILGVSSVEIQAPTLDTAQDAGAGLDAIVYDIDVPLNAKVLRFVELLTGRLKLFLEEGLSRGVRYLPMIQNVFRAEGLPLDLAFVPLVESAFKPTALSRAKAGGIWQFMRGTGLENGLAHDWYVDERAEPEKATLAAAKFLKALNTTFDGDWHLALAAYNGGPARVQRAVKRSGRTDFWELAASTKYLPRETRDYVPLILAAIIIARNPAQYEMNVQPFDTPRFETVTLSAAVDLRRLAEWSGTPIQVIRELNPELRRWTTPVRATDYELKVPDGTGDIIRAHLAQTDPGDLAPLDWHTVKKGDTLLSVAKTLQVTPTDLAEANYLLPKARLQVGQRLIVPRAPTLLLASQPDSPLPVTESGPVAAVVTASDIAPDAGRPLQASLTHRVKRGDTLFSIARLYRTTIASLKNWNRLRTDSIQVGQQLTIVTERTTTATN